MLEYHIDGSLTIFFLSHAMKDNAQEITWKTRKLWNFMQMNRAGQVNSIV